jgi:hypothetical protein
MSLAELDVSLGKEEQVLGEWSFSYSILLFFIKSKFYLTNKRFILKIPNVVLMILPLGANTATYPLRNIAAIRSRTKFKFFQLVFGAILAVVGLGLLTSSPLGLILFLIGIIVGVNSFQALVNVEPSSGRGVWYSIAIWELTEAKKMANQINQAIADM